MDPLEKYGPFTPEESGAFAACGNLSEIKRKTIIFEGGKTFDRLYLLKEGIIRAFRLIDGEDFTYYFFTDGDFAVDYQSFLSGEPSPLLFESLTDVKLVRYTKADIYGLYERFPKFERLGRLMAENAYLSAAERLKQHQTDDLKTRYVKLIAKNPKLFQSVPQHYIASYLGVRAQSLSRIRAEIAGRKY